MLRQKYTTSLFILLLAVTTTVSAKSDQYFPINTWVQDDGLIGTVRSISGGPFETRDACEKAMVYKLTKVTKKMGAAKFEITTREIVNHETEIENEIVMYIRGANGNVSQHNCLKLR